MSIEPEELMMICCSDIAGQVRGKGFPARDAERRRRFGIGWTPTNVMINCLGRIPATPFGPHGDLYLAPADGTEVALAFTDGGPATRWCLGTIHHLDGTPWDCCLRSLLARALDALRTRTGLELVVAFEHEFHHFSADERSGDAYGLSCLRGVEPFVGDFLGALRSNGLAPETFLPEYGPRQFEVTVDPAPALQAADRAVNLREIAKAVARQRGDRVSFSPVVSLGVVGNGVHVHFSLTDREGRPVTYEASRPGGLSATAGAFAAGIVRHAPALCAVTAPSILSYTRLQPHSWSAYWGNLGFRDREALVRICPVPEHADVDPAPRYNLEFRAADAAASPYLQLAMLVFAGLAGVEAQLATPPITEEDPETFTAARRAELGIQELPRSLAAALTALEQDTAAMGWLGPVLGPAYLMHKRGELGMLEGKSDAELVAIYAEAY